jgi:hypothetical protein
VLGEYRRHPSDEPAVGGRSPEACVAELPVGSPNRRHALLPAEPEAGAFVAPREAVSVAGRAELVDGAALEVVARPLICPRLRCCCANGTRLTAAGWLWLKKCVLLKFVVLRAVTGRSERRRLEAVGAIGTCPLTKLADRSCSALTCMVLVKRPLANSLELTAVTPFVIRAFR